MFSETSVYRKLLVAQPDNISLSGLVVSVALLEYVLSVAIILINPKFSS